MHHLDLWRIGHEQRQTQIHGTCLADPARLHRPRGNVATGELSRYTDSRQCLEPTQPDICILGPATARHGEWVEQLAPLGVHILLVQPMAASLADADRMIRAVEAIGKTLVINWPLAWYPPHITAKRLIDEGTIGEVIEVHYYDGNRGPLRHLADKIEVSEEEAARQKSQSWWYRKESGGGSLLDYLGYGVTLGTWFHGGRAPLEVTTVVDEPPGLEVDEHSVTTARYPYGLSKYETRWGTFTDPWTTQPQPKCGFVIVGTKGTISSYDYEEVIHVQTSERPSAQAVPVDTIDAPFQNPIQYLIHCLETGEPVRGPLSPAMSRVGQQIVDTAVLSAREKRTVSLLS